MKDGYTFGGRGVHESLQSKYIAIPSTKFIEVAYHKRFFAAQHTLNPFSKIMGKVQDGKLGKRDERSARLENVVERRTRHFCHGL
jgi:hypothetical protein